MDEEKREHRRFDSRTAERFVREGILGRDEYQEHLDSLPDVADKAEPMEAEFVDGVLDDDEPEEADAEDAGDDADEEQDDE